jgi:hypothetical protein
VSLSLAVPIRVQMAAARGGNRRINRVRARAIRPNPETRHGPNVQDPSARPRRADG